MTPSGVLYPNSTCEEKQFLIDRDDTARQHGCREQRWKPKPEGEGCAANKMDKGNIHPASVRHSTAAEKKLTHDASLVGVRSLADHTFCLAPSIQPHTMKADTPMPWLALTRQVYSWDYPLLFQSTPVPLGDTKFPGIHCWCLSGSSFLLGGLLSFL